MRLSLGFLIRQARRLGLTSFPSRQRQEASSKHLKIDDEEQQLNHGSSSAISSRFSHLPGFVKMLLLSLLLILGAIFFTAYIIYKPPSLVIGYLQWKYPDVLFHLPLPESQKIVALTLDDAPSDETTKMLDLLKTYGSKATFFVIGSQIAAHPEILKRIHNEGHELGNHAWRDEPSLSLPLSELEQQVKEVETLIPANPAGTKYFRPGSGFFNKAMVARLKTLGYRVVLGSIYPHDPQIHSARLNARHVLSMLKPGGIIIMHDRRPYSAEQLKLVLEGLTTKGWKAESVGGLLRISEDTRVKKAG